MRNFSRSISLFLFLRTSENARTRAISKTRDKISRLIQKKQKKKAKIRLFKRLPLLFKEHKKVSLLFRSKIQKNSKRILQNRQRENNEKSIRRRRSPLGRHSTHHHFVALIYIFTAHLQSNVLATVERRVFLFETRRISRLFQRWYSRKR